MPWYRRMFLRLTPGRSDLMGTPSLSLPPAMVNLYPGRLTKMPSTTSPIFLPMRELA